MIRIFCTRLWVLVGLCFPGLAGADVPADSVYARAMAAGHKDSLKQAVKTLEDMVSDHADPAGVYTLVGQLHLKARNGDDAIKAFRRALEADGARIAAHLGLGMAYLDVKTDWRGALPHVQAALDLDSMRAESHYHMARVYMETNINRARHAAGRAVTLDGNYAPGYLLLARIYEADGLDEPALFYYNEYLKRQPEDQEAAYQFARRLAESGRRVEAERLLGRLNDPRAYAVLAKLMMQTGHYEDALQAFEEYISELPADEQALYYDISIVATPREAAVYKSTTPERMRDFLRQFWLKKDPLKASGGLMRWCEHYRRVLYAREHYGKRQFPWDRRGEVYIRYGEPDYRSSSRSLNADVPQDVQVLQMELARRLYGPDGVNHTFLGPVFPVRTDRFLNVIGEDSPELDDLPRMNHESMLGRAGMAAEDTLGFYGYKPVTLGLAGMTVKWEVWFYTRIAGGIEVVFTDEFTSGRYDYAPPPILTTDDRLRLDQVGHDELLRVSRVFTEASPSTFMSRITGEVPEVYDISRYEALDFHFDTVDFRGPDGKTEVRVFTGLPVNRLYVPQASDTAHVQRRVALIQEGSGQVHRVQGDFVVETSARSASVLVEEFPLLADPGRYTLALQVWRPGTPLMGAYTVERPVRSFAADSLMVSSIQVARKVEKADSTDGQFVRSGFRVTPAPGRVFYRGDPFFLYFEIYNLQQDAFGQTRYEVAYTVRDANQSPLIVRALSGLGRVLSGGGGQESVTVRYEQTGTESWTGDFVELDVTSATAGQHEVVATVRDLNSGAEVVGQVRFHVVDRGGQASRP